MISVNYPAYQLFVFRSTTYRSTVTKQIKNYYPQLCNKYQGEQNNELKNIKYMSNSKGCRSLQV